MTNVQLQGILPKPKLSANGAVYRGRFTCFNVQWTGAGTDIFATFTITAGEIADAAESNMLWTDQDVQRGIQPAAIPKPPRELSLAAGYPDSAKYIFDGRNADDMVEKLLDGEQLFLNPLVWNLRPGSFEAYWNASDAELYIYSGHIYLPDSHHRRQAIAKAVSVWREKPDDYPKFTDRRQFKVELYFLTREDEGNYFFDKNQRPKPTAKSKAYDLTTQDDLSLLAKMVIDESKNLHENVNRITDRIDNKNAQVITMSTLREMMRTFAAAEHIDSSELDGISKVAAEFYDLLVQVRPELGRLNVEERRQVRASSIVDAAVMMHGYAAIMREYNLDLARIGSAKAKKQWAERLDRLKRHNVYRFGDWAGSLFDKSNPLWATVGIVRPGVDGRKPTVLNTGAARGEAGRVLRQLLTMEQTPSDLMFLGRR